MIKGYEIYKHSGSKFIGEIPIEWECERLSTLGNFLSSGIDKKTHDSETPVRMVNYTDLIKI